MRRREFIGLLSSAVMGVPLAAGAGQTLQMRRVGVLMSTSDADPYQRRNYAAFAQSFEELGWITGRNVLMDERWAAGDAERMRAYARQLLAAGPDAVVAQGSALLAMTQASASIPIVFVLGSSPWFDSMVDNLARPRGNVTGFSHIEVSMAGKWPELLKEIAPRLKRVAFLYNPKTTPSAEYGRMIKSASASLGIESIVDVPIADVVEFEGAVAHFALEPNGGLVIMSDAFTVDHRDKIIDLAARYHLPAVYPFSVFCRSGGLLSYGADVPDLFRRAATYVDRILKGEKPGDLPVQQPTKFELVINLKTAKALGLTIPPTLLARTDEVIE
jgi:putative tryptophan/tyrosine transport system substrate-binding protein